MKSISVRLPNGNSVLANMAGIVRVNDELVLKDVLYLPDFNLNLISIPKLTKGSKCKVYFADDSCIIQDHSLWIIGSGKLKQGLYYLDYGGGNKVSVITNVTVSSHDPHIPQSILWHYRFGHASHAKLESLSKHFSNVAVNKHLVCDICHFARQRKLPFHVSSSKASCPFDLIHLDV